MATANLFIRFVVPGVAQPRGSKTIGRNKAGQTWIRDDNPDSAKWMKVVATAAKQCMRAANKTPSAKPLVLFVTIYRHRPAGDFGTGRNADLLKPGARQYPTTKPDLTKCIRGIEDAMNEVVWMDDSQVVEQRTKKRYVESESWETWAASEIKAGRVPCARPKDWGRPRVEIAVYELPVSVAGQRPVKERQGVLV
jgi:Holliday junction resolvase RusA-like endonuclease